MSPAGIVFATYGAVLIAELAGDRSLYAIASLTARFRPLPILIGVVPAYALKTLAAVLVADAITHLPSRAVAAISLATWILAGYAVWRQESGHEHGSSFASRLRHPSVAAFASIAFTEWGDPGQLAAAGLAAHFRTPLLVWSGATAALITKALAAIVVGITARRFLYFSWLRFGAMLLCLVNGVIALVALVRG